MSQGTPHQAPEPAGAWRHHLATPAAVALAGLIAVGSYHFFYAKKNYAYLIDRDRRVLATRATQIRQAIDSERQLLPALYELGAPVPAGLAEGLRKLREQHEVKIGDAQACADAAPGHRDGGGGGHRQVPPGTPAPVFLGLEPAPDGYHFGFRYRNVCASVRLEELLDPLLASRKAFDAILLADAADGTVFYQRPGINVSHLQALLPASTGSATGGTKAASESGGEGAAADLRSLRGGGGELEVELRGRKFKLFVQPLTLPTAAPEAGRARPSGGPQAAKAETAAAGGREGDAQELLLCGLVPADDLLYGSIELSPEILGAAVALLLLSLLSWPLLKLRLLGEHRRLRLADVVMVAACSLLGVSWLTLSLLGLRQHRLLERLADEQLEDFASGMARNLESEIRSAYAQLEILENAAAGSVATAAAKPSAAKPTAARPAAARPDAQDLQGDLLARRPPLLTAYPFAESFMLIRADGSIALRWTTDKVPLVPRHVSSRQYFRRVLHRDLWRLPPPGPRRSAGGSGCDAGAPAGSPPGADLGEPFTVESLASSISGYRQAVLSKPAAAGPDSRIKVAALSMPMLSVIRPVTPPDLEFAVIDDGGAVLFHSDPDRNNVENLFAETDQDLHLRSAVAARHRATLGVRYWGNDYRAAAEPVRGPPWTIVALRPMGALEAANVEAIVTALVFLLIYAGGFGAALVAIALLRPSYRPEWLWPSPRRSNDYLRLLLLYLLLSVVFAAAAVLLPGDERLVAAAGLMSLLVLVLGYLQLARRRWRPPARMAWAAGLLLPCILLGRLLAPRGSSGRGPDPLAAWLPFALVLPVVLGAAFVVLARPAWWRQLTRPRRVAVAWAHPALGLLLLVLLAVLPAVAIFKTAETIQVENFVKRGQLELRDKLLARRARAERLYDDQWGAGKRRLLELRCAMTGAAAAGGQTGTGTAAEGPARAGAWGLDLYAGPFFATRISAPAGKAGAGGAALAEEEPMWDLFEDLLPVYSSQAAASRELIHDRATDGGWQWDRRDGALALESEALRLRLVSQPPRSWLAGAAPPGWNAASAAGTGVAAALLLALLAGLSWFISRRVFLVDLVEPLWTGREGALPATVGSNIFLVNRCQHWHLAAPETSFVRLHCKELEQETPGWPAKRLELLRSQPGRSVVVEGFEHRILEPDFNARKLALLEDLVLQHRTVVVLSTVHPHPLLARAPAVAGDAPSPAAPAAPAVPPDDSKRWRALLDAFTLIDEDLRPRVDEANLANLTVRGWRDMQLLLRRVRKGGEEEEAQDYHFKSPLLAAECGDNPVLIQLGRELDPFTIGLDRRQLLEELGERAELYYRSLWASCGDDEKLVLGHLAEDGLANEHDRKWVRRLMARGLIRREPVCRLMNETFRRFVLSQGCRREVLELEQHTGPSPWEHFRRPFFATVAAGIVFFLATQKEVLNGTLAIATAVTAALPAMGKVLGLISGRHGGGAARR
ncbi:MAG TPA: hypothetical protein VHB47_22715 [Thermoanaerobaculia bacterium]|nr:hypothetical protein [Thermoanaerobaculia bacterium]